MIFKRELYRDTSEIENQIKQKSNMVSSVQILSSQASEFNEGEIRIDGALGRIVVKKDGKLYAQQIIDNEIVLKEI